MQAKIGEEGGIERVVAAMAAHPQSPGVQEQACGTLGALAGNKVNGDQIVWAGGIERTVAAMAEHSAARVQEIGCASLRSLAFKNPANQVAILRAGGVERVLWAFNTATPLLQKVACLTLLTLASHSGVVDRIKAAGGMPRMEHAIAARDGDDETKRLATSIMGKLKAASPGSAADSPLASPVKGGARFFKTSTPSGSPSPESSPTAAGLRRMSAFDGPTGPTADKRQPRRRSLQDCDPRTRDYPFLTIAARPQHGLRLPKVDGLPQQLIEQTQKNALERVSATFNRAGTRARGILSAAGQHSVFFLPFN